MRPTGHPDLFAARGDRFKRPASAEMVPRFLNALQGRGWVAGAVVAQELGSNLRTVRAAAHESGGLILGGDKGYALTTQASLEDVTAVVNRHYSQARQMRARAMQIEKVRHGTVSTGDAA